MECKDIIAVLSKFQDEELDKDSSDIVKKHLKQCVSCREESDQLGEVLYFLKGQTEIKAPDNFTAVTMGRLNKKNKKRFSPLPAFVYSFVFALFFFLGIFINFGPVYSGEKNETIDSVSELLLNSQELSLLNVQNNSFSDLLGVEDEKRMD